ncbi:MAG: metal ABC transporter permease [Mycobacteriaceae bacterium]|nr:metal ABC transporter permease [Mycobacteriaceae bacterium]
MSVLVAIECSAVQLGIARPLLFATIDPAVAAAAGVPTRLLGAVFLAVAGATVAEASQIVGALLVLGLMAAPAGAVAHLTSRPWRGFWLSAGIAVAAIWVGVVLAYLVPAAPASFTIMTCAAATYAAAALLGSRTRSARRRRVTA